jgi:hypothetical protein
MVLCLPLTCHFSSEFQAWYLMAVQSHVFAHRDLLQAVEAEAADGGSAQAWSMLAPELRDGVEGPAGQSCGAATRLQPREARGMARPALAPPGGAAPAPSAAPPTAQVLGLLQPAAIHPARGPEHELCGAPFAVKAAPGRGAAGAQPSLSTCSAASSSRPAQQLPAPAHPGVAGTAQCTLSSDDEGVSTSQSHKRISDVLAATDMAIVKNAPAEAGCSFLAPGTSVNPGNAAYCRPSPRHERQQPLVAGQAPGAPVVMGPPRPRGAAAASAVPHPPHTHETPLAAGHQRPTTQPGQPTRHAAVPAIQVGGACQNLSEAAGGDPFESLPDLSSAAYCVDDAISGGLPGASPRFALNNVLGLPSFSVSAAVGAAAAGAAVPDATATTRGACSLSALHGHCGAVATAAPTTFAAPRGPGLSGVGIAGLDMPALHDLHDGAHGVPEKGGDSPKSLLMFGRGESLYGAIEGVMVGWAGAGAGSGADSRAAGAALIDVVQNGAATAQGRGRRGRRTAAAAQEQTAAAQDATGDRPFASLFVRQASTRQQRRR